MRRKCAYSWCRRSESVLSRALVIVRNVRAQVLSSKTLEAHGLTVNLQVGIVMVRREFPLSAILRSHSRASPPVHEPKQKDEARKSAWQSRTRMRRSSELTNETVDAPCRTKLSVGGHEEPPISLGRCHRIVRCRAAAWRITEHKNALQLNWNRSRNVRI